MHPSRENKSSHCPSHREVISQKGCRTANLIAVVCCVKSKQTSKRIFKKSVALPCKRCVEQQSLHSRRSILVIDGLNEISSPFLGLVWFIFFHKFTSSTFIPFTPHLISESHALARTEKIINFLARNWRQRQGDADRARISFVNPLKLEWHACQGITEQVMSFCHT